MERIATRLLIRGRVQGVGYRAWACGQARRLGLDGWVRNREDGSVELLAAGSASKLAELAELCRRGPPAALVASIEQTSAQDNGLTAFELRPTF